MEQHQDRFDTGAYLRRHARDTVERVRIKEDYADATEMTFAPPVKLDVDSCGESIMCVATARRSTWLTKHEGKWKTWLHFGWGAQSISGEQEFDTEGEGYESLFKRSGMAKAVEPCEHYFDFIGGVNMCRKCNHREERRVMSNTEAVAFGRIQHILLELGSINAAGNVIDKLVTCKEEF